MSETIFDKSIRNDEKCFFTLKALFVPTIFKFLYGLFGHAGKRLDQKEKVSFKIYDVITLANNCHVHTGQYLKKQKQADISQLVEYNMRIIFLKNDTQDVAESYS